MLVISLNNSTRICARRCEYAFYPYTYRGITLILPDTYPPVSRCIPLRSSYEYSISLAKLCRNRCGGLLSHYCTHACRKIFSRSHVWITQKRFWKTFENAKWKTKWELSRTFARLSFYWKTARKPRGLPRGWIAVMFFERPAGRSSSKNISPVPSA